MDGRTFESSGYLIRALVNDARVHVGVELFVDAVRDLMEIGDDGGSAGTESAGNKLAMNYGATAEARCARSGSLNVLVLSERSPSGLRPVDGRTMTC